MESAEEQYIKRLQDELRDCKDYNETRTRFSWNIFKGFSEEYEELVSRQAERDALQS